MKELEIHINSSDKSIRLEALKRIKRKIKQQKQSFPQSEEVNNHVHTIYSFSPYSPAAAVFTAYKSGLKAVGIVDHDSVAGCKEMLEAGKILGIATTCGFEIRVNFTGTALANKKINNPDSYNLAYIVIHGVPANELYKADAFLKPLRTARNKRNYQMVERLNQLINPFGIGLIDYHEDVYQISQAFDGGSITERHILCAFADKLIRQFGQGEELIHFLADKLSLKVDSKIQGNLSDSDNPFYLYDLIGLLKSTFLDRFFIQPDEEECISVASAVEFGNSIQAIPVYAYLGDVSESPTGDKKPEKFEDDYLDTLFPILKELGFKGITYMPPRNTLAQLKRVQHLCRQYDLMEISGVDINSIRQSFNCPIILTPEFQHLTDNTWALIAHEKLAGLDKRYALFHPQNPLGSSPLTERINLYSKLGRKIDPYQPENLRELAESVNRGGIGK